MGPDMTTLYFKDHQNSIKDKSTMKNALGYKFEKKKKAEAEEQKEPWGDLAANDSGQGKSFGHHKDHFENRKNSGYNSKAGAKRTYNYNNFN